MDSAPRYGSFAGVLEGRVGDADALRRAALGVQATKTAPSDLEVEGGRFSFLFDEAPVKGSQLDQDAQAALLDALQAIVDASADPSRVESTLRGTLVYEDSVIETLFVSQAGELEAISRKRALSEADRASAAKARQEGQDEISESRLKGGLMLALVAAAGLLLAWQRGYIAQVQDMFMGSDAAELTLEAGPFQGALALDVKSKLSLYVVEVQRDKSYPATADEAEAYIQAAVSAEDRAAANAVANGDSVWLRVENADGKVLAAKELSLRPLLSDGSRTIQVELPSKLGASQIVLALDRGEFQGKVENGETR